MKVCADVHQANDGAEENIRSKQIQHFFDQMATRNCLTVYIVLYLYVESACVERSNN